jgi:hypothetical protein
MILYQGICLQNKNPYSGIFFNSVIPPTARLFGILPMYRLREVVSNKTADDSRHIII